MERNREGGEVRPKRPTAGKEKPGITSYQEELREVLRHHKPYKLILIECIEGERKFSLSEGLHSYTPNGVGACLVENPVKRIGTEEPYELIAHVRVCGEGVG